MISIDTILSGMKQPEPYQAGAELWRDPHIAGEMLKAHLSPDTDAASYKPDTIKAICDSLPARMGLKPGGRIIDLGCGPGLYCRRLAGVGYAMTGLDWSANSIRFAEASSAGLGISYRISSYLEPFGQEEYDGALLIYQDYGVLAPDRRQALLRNIRAALRPGGVLALDVPGMEAFDAFRQTASPAWEAADKGFWRPHPYLMLSAAHFYPGIPASCSLYAVLDDAAVFYRVWQTYFTPDSIRGELREGGFDVTGIMAGLQGGPWAVDSPVIGVICRKS